MSTYDTYAVRIPPQAIADKGPSPRTMQIAQLFQNPIPANMGEWVWRVGYPLTALVLCLLAVPLSYVNPRAGRSMNVVFAIFIYVAYNNLVGLSEGWVGRAKLSATEGILFVHGAMFLIMVIFYWQRFRGPWAR
jgi:lipopolysaccharide export system permease protein